MNARPLALRVCACALVAFGAVAVGAACLSGSVINLLENVPFDGGYLGPCSDGAVKTIPAQDCPGTCSGANATAICVGTSFGECSCLPSTATICDSGCCADDATAYQPIHCEGHVVIPDPSEGLCSGRTGYLVCNWTEKRDAGCFARFACEIPDGYSLQSSGPDATAEAGHPTEGGTEGGGGHDAGDAGTDAPEGSHDAGDSGTDAPPADAPVDAAKG
jgi:hypothetical protein